MTTSTTAVFTPRDVGYPVSPEAQRLYDNAGPVEIVRELGDDVRDPEVGRMFTIRFSDGTTADAFADELDVIA